MKLLSRIATRRLSMKTNSSRRLNMETNTSLKRLVIVVALGVALSGLPTYTAGSNAIAADPSARSEMSGPTLMTALPAQASDAVMEWNLEAVRLTLTSTPTLAPVEQARVMAIIQVAVHDAVNGITGRYATHLSPGP